MSKVDNLDHFIGVLLIDKLLYNADGRQCVYVNTGARFHAHMIDFGYAFNGPNWDTTNHDLSGLYCRPIVYDALTSLAALDPWLTRVETMPLSVFSDAIDSMPTEWLAPTDREQLLRLSRAAHRGRQLLRTTLSDLFNRRTTHFPSWQRPAA
jgi:hypothetical protein